jgi:anti-sigma regulatory factor (Ser/Thr protein kinase)
MRLAVGPGTAGMARAAIRDSLPSASRTVVADAELLTSELVTNAIRHSGLGPKDTVGLNIDVMPKWVRVAVLDEGPGFERRPRPRGPDGGWGLFLVDTVSYRWGVNDGGITEVWFELHL